MAKSAKQASAKSAPALKVEKKSADLQRLEQICEIMQAHNLGEIEWEKGNERLRLRAKDFVGGMGAMPMPTYSAPASASNSAAKLAGEASSAKPAGAPAINPNHKQVVSPFVGTFYRSASPGAENYVKEGQTVKRGDVLCIIEAMKLMNEIETDFAGKIISCQVENGQPVEFGEVLFIVETS